MQNQLSLRPETRYGMPAADQTLINRHYIVGYSYYFRQAKWALEIIDPDKEDLPRADDFRPDYRIPEMFRADLADYTGSGYDRGHLVASADQRETELQNSETFLLSNMCPQTPQFNRDIWKKLEVAVRELNDHEDIFETYVISGPIFDFDKPVSNISAEDGSSVSLPIPHAFFKSILTENNKGTLRMWSFVLANEDSDKPLSEFLVSTDTVEKQAGILLWEALVGEKIEKEKARVRQMWTY